MSKEINLKEFIVPTKISNISNDSSFDTQDYIYIKSYEDVKLQSHIQMAAPATDYALLNGNDQYIEKGNCYGSYWLRSCSKKENRVDSVYRGNLQTHSMDKHCFGLRPSMTLDVEKVTQAIRTLKEFGNIQEVKSSDGKEIYYTMEFGEYPKTIVEPELNQKLEINYAGDKLTATGKTYTSAQNVYGIYGKNKEYIYNDEKYVRVKVKTNNDFILFSDHSNAKDLGSYQWVKVEPITWRINNWKEMPRNINPQGYGTATSIEVTSENIITSGVPFFPNEIDYRVEDSKTKYWQNSSIRGYLNGINVNRIQSNGNLEYNIDGGGDFNNSGFINEVFGDARTYEEQEEIPEIDAETQNRRTNSYGIQVIDEPMSVEEQIKFYIDNGKSFMLHGASGVGKTRRIEEADPDYVSIVLRNGILPEEVIGKTIFPNDDKRLGGVWSPPAWYVSLCEKCEKEPDKNHVLFIDEITNVKPSEQSLVFHLVLNNSIGPNIGQLPKNVVVVAAGNTKEESEAAYNMPEPLYRRFEGHIELRPEVQKFLEWGSEKSKKGEDRLKVHPIVAAFVGTYGDDVFYSPYDSEEPPKFAIDPRGWEQVSDIIYDNKGVIRRELIENKVGHQIASAFMAFAKNPPLTLYDVLDKNYTKEDIPTSFDAKYALALSLRSATEQEIKVVREFIKNELGNEILSMFDSLWIGDDNERAIAIKQSNDVEEKTM